MKAVVAIPLLLAACSDDADPAVPSGPHHTYVVDQLTLPASREQTRELGLDLNGDATVDNQLGTAIAVLTSQGFLFQPALDRAVATGAALMLIDIQSEDLDRADAAGIELMLGASPSPAPCADAADPVCRRHLDGMGTFSITGDRHVPMIGSIKDEVMYAGPGTSTLQLALGGTATTTVELRHARVRVESISDTGVASLVFAGAVSKAAVTEQMIPLFQRSIGEQITSECSAGVAPPECGCPSGSGARVMIELLDDSPRDCVVSLEEVRDNTTTQTLTGPDVFLDEDGGLTSIGLGMTAVPATFVE